MKPEDLQHNTGNSPANTGEVVPSGNDMARTLTDLVDVMDTAMWELDRDYTICGCNRKARKLYGEEVLGLRCYQAAAGRDAVCEGCPVEQIYAGADSGRSQRQRTLADGTILHIDHLATPVRDENGSVTGVLVLISDITRQKELEQELITHRANLEQLVTARTRQLEQSHEQYRRLYEESRQGKALYLSLLNAAADAIIIYDLHGMVQFLNPSFTHTFGWRLDELQGKPLPFATNADSAQTAAAFHALLDVGRPISHLLGKRTTREGRTLDVSISAARYNNSNNETAGIICSLRDITEAKSLEMQLQRAQKFESLGTMASGIAHDFNNLLMGIQGNASLMLLDLPRGITDKKKLENIEQYVSQGEKLTRQLLSLVKREVKYELRPIDLNVLLVDCATLFGQTKKEIAIRHDLQQQIWPVEANAGQIEQVLLNLFVNAAHAMPMGGNLFLHTENVAFEQQDEASNQGRPGRFVKVTVTDTGHGIHPSLVDKIFDPFFSTREKEGGTGLGLASAYSIITNHGGFINAANSCDGGAQFSLYLPACDRRITCTPELGDDFPAGTETILLVDDEEPVLHLTRELLEQLGYRIYSASSGE